jgi:uncharacterized membrane protein HdeD (DUF308 family)
MRKNVKKYSEGWWWGFLLRSIAAICFGLLAVFATAEMLWVVMMVGAIILIFMGVVKMVSTFAGMDARHWFLDFLVALLEIVAGAYLAFNVRTGTELLAVIVGAFILVRGIIEFVMGIVGTGSYTKALWVLAGLVGIGLGLIIIYYPLASNVAFVWLFGIYALVVGVMDLGYAIRLRVNARGRRKSGGRRRKA